jgi:hypothetical protein
VRANYSGVNSLFTVQRNFTTLADAMAKNENEEISESGTIKQNKPWLEQNIPNPFAGKTTINYYLPHKYKTAQIVIVNNSGIIIEFVPLKGSGKGSITFNARTMASETYNYSLYVDGKLIDSRQMMLLK